MSRVLAVLLAALCFSTTGTAQALAAVNASPLAVGAARVLVGGGILGLVALLAGRSASAAGVPAAAGSRRVPSWAVVALGAAGVLGYQPAFFAGTASNGVAVGTVVALGSAPVVTGALEGVLRRRAPGVRWAVATTVSLAGVVLVSGLVGQGAGPSAISPAGVLASVGAGASYAVYALASKELLDRGWPPARTMGAVFGAAAVVSLPILLIAGASWLLTPAGAALALWLGVVTTAVAYLLFAWGLARLRATTVATLTLAEPLAAALLGLVVLHERLAPSSVLGLAVVAAGLVLLTRPARGAARRGSAEA